MAHRPEGSQLGIPRSRSRESTVARFGYLGRSTTSTASRQEPSLLGPAAARASQSGGMTPIGAAPSPAWSFGSSAEHRPVYHLLGTTACLREHLGQPGRAGTTHGSYDLENLLKQASPSRGLILSVTKSIKSFCSAILGEYRASDTFLVFTVRTWSLRVVATASPS